MNSRKHNPSARAATGAGGPRGPAAKPAKRRKPVGAAKKRPSEPERLAEELRTHQVELEMQNDELRRTQTKLSTALADYTELYDQAPVGYLTLSKTGMILQANLTAAALLNVPRNVLINQPFAWYIHGDDQSVYYLHCKRLFDSPAAGQDGTCELRMLRKAGAPFWARITASAAVAADGERMARATLIDITEHKRAEQAQRESEERLELALRSSRQGLWDWNIARDEAYLSPMYYELIGCREGEIQPNLAFFQSSIHPDDLPTVAKTMADHLQGKCGDYRIEYRVRMRSGEYKWMNGIGKVVERDLTGAPLRMIGTIVDIDDRKQAQEALQRERDFSQAALESMPGLFYLFNEQGRYLHVNKKFLVASGYSADDLEKMSPVDFFDGPDRERVAAAIRQVFETGESSVEADLVSKDGGRTPFFFTGTRILFDQKSCVMGVGIEISKRKRAEETLRESETLYRTLVETTGTGYVVLDTAGNVVDANEEYVRLTGRRSLNEIRGRSVIEWTACYEKLRNSAAVAKCARDGYVRNLEIDYSDPQGQGQITPIEINATVVTIGGTPRIVTLCRDISEHRRTEKLLLQAQDTLENTVEQRTQELHWANLKLQAEMEARLKNLTDLNHLRHIQSNMTRSALMGELAGSIAHELNQPLTAILCNAQVAQRLISGENVNTPELREILDNIIADNRHAGEIIRSLRLLFKTGHVNYEPVDVNDVVQKAVKLTGNDLASHDTVLANSLAPGLPIIQADGVQLLHVLTNLISNACAAMADVAASDRSIAIRTDLLENGHVQISVTDRGCGIDLSGIKKIFEPFHSTNPDRLGLGLSICRTIVSAHGGKIWAINNADRGATFHFTLPKEKVST